MYNQSINVPINLNLIRITVEALYNSHLGDRRKWPLWRDGRYGEVGISTNSERYHFRSESSHDRNY